MDYKINSRRKPLIQMVEKLAKTLDRLYFSVILCKIFPNLFRKNIDRPQNVAYTHRMIREGLVPSRLVCL